MLIRIQVNWMVLYWVGLDWIGLDRAELACSGWKRSELKWSGNWLLFLFPISNYKFDSLEKEQLENWLYFHCFMCPSFPLFYLILLFLLYCVFCIVVFCLILCFVFGVAWINKEQNILILVKNGCKILNLSRVLNLQPLNLYFRYLLCSFFINTNEQ